MKKLILFLNHDCNLACTYCYNGNKFHKAISEKTIYSAIDIELNDKPLHLIITFFGGEPLLEFNLIKKAVEYVEKKTKDKTTRVSFGLITNGTLLNQKKIDYLVYNKFHISVSLDGCEKAHNLTRPFISKKPSFNLIKNNIKNALKKYPLLEIVSVIDPLNVQFLDESTLFFAEIGIKKVNYSINYDGNWNEKNLELFKIKINQSADNYYKLLTDGYNIKINPFDAKIITQLKSGYCKGDFCKFGLNEITVTPSGRIYPCERLVGEDGEKEQELSIGDIKQGINIEKRTKLITRKREMDPECVDCDLNNRCMHWCGCVNYALTGDIGRVSGLLCYFEKEFIEASDRIAAKLYKDKNQIFMNRFYQFKP